MGQVSLGFNAEHTHRDDIRVEIESPAGTSVQAVMHKYGATIVEPNNIYLPLVMRDSGS